MKKYTFFKNKPEPVLKEAADRRKEIDDFIIALTRRIQIQQSYARNLFNVGKSMQKYTKDETRISCSVFSAFQLSNENRGMQVYAFCKSIKEQVLQKLKDLHFDQCGEARTLQKDVKKIEQQLNSQLDYAKKMKYRFEDIEKDYQENLITNEVMEILVSTPEDKRLKSKNKYNDMYQEIALHKENYLKAENQYNTTREKYYHDVENLLEILQQHELQRLSLQIDSVMKILVFETSMIKNFEYDIKNITSRVNKQQIQNDITHFVEQNNLLKNERIYTVLDETNHNIFRETIYQMTSNDYINQRSEFEKNINLKKFLEKKLKKVEVLQIEGVPSQTIKSYNFLTDILDKSLTGLEITSDEFVKFSTQIQDDLKRYLISKYLIQYQFNAYFKLNEQAFIKTFNIIQEILLKCLTKKEMFLVRKLINLTFYYYLEPDCKKESNNNNNSNRYKTYLFVKLIGREELKSEELWSTIIYSSIQDELITIIQRIRNKEEAEMRQSSTIFSQLGEHSHHMIMLGVPLKTIKKIISRFCRIYNLDENKIIDISKCLAAAFAQFKQKYCSQQLLTELKFNTLTGDQFNLF